MLKLGYKASAEQFAPRELLEFAVHAEAVGFDSVVVSDHFQPWRHTGGHAPYSFAWLGALGERTTRALHRHQRRDPDLPLPPGDRRPGDRHARRALPGPRDARRRHRRVAERGAGDRHRVAAVQGALRPPARGDRADAAARARGPRHLRRRVLPHRASATIYDRPEAPVPIYVAASGAVAARLAGRIGDGFICTSGKAKELYTETLLPALAEGLEKAGRAPDSIERMIEMKVSFDTDLERALEDTRHWAALALTPEEKTGVEDPVEMERLADALPVERAASRWIVSTTRTSTSSGWPRPSAGLHPPGVPRPGPGPGALLDLYAEQVLPRLRDALRRVGLSPWRRGKRPAMPLCAR